MERSVLVTGGTGGLGAAVTTAFLDAGWRVVVPWIAERELARVPERDGLELVKADLFDIRRRIGSDVTLRGILRPSFPDLATEGDFIAAVEALRAGGVDELAFYNYGHLRRANLQWIGAALGGQA